MKTTLDLPEDLLRRAERAAVERGVTLPVLVKAALVRELDAAVLSEAGKRRVRFPIFISKQPGSLDLTAGDIAQAEGQEDARRHGVPR